MPLFVEELTKAVLESAARGDQVAAVLATTASAAQAVPATLHASLIGAARPAWAGDQGDCADRRSARMGVQQRASKTFVLNAG
jgi:hypothetical protein